MIYDSIIVGGGPCGVTAGIYLARSGRKVLLLEKSMIGGQILYTPNIENYPGFVGGDGFTLCQNFMRQLSHEKVEVKYEEAISFDFSEKIKKILTSKGTYLAKTVILCLGAESKKLNVANESNLAGKGVSYCAVCDGSLFKDKSVCVIGGGNTAVEEAIYLSDIVKTVNLVVRRDEFRAERSLVDTLYSKKENGKDINIIFNSVACDIEGFDKVTSINLENTIDNTKSNIKVDGVFVAIGRVPNTKALKGILDLDEMGYIKTSVYETSVSGVFAGGDVIQKNLRQVATAVADGALISVEINNYLRKI